MDFSEVLRRWRAVHRLTTREAALVLNVSAAAICRWENEKRTPSDDEAGWHILHMQDWTAFQIKELQKLDNYNKKEN